MTRRFGIEIEATGMTKEEVVALLADNGINVSTSTRSTHEVMNTWKVVGDASISGRMGFEVVSPPLSGANGLREVRKVVELLNEAGCDVNKSCGIHVHIDCNDLTAQHIANIWNRYRANEAQIDSFMPRSRRASNNQYCGTLTTQPELTAAQDVRSTCRQRPNRYYKVNLTSYAKYGTVEFRQHSGSLNAAKINHWINFLLQFVEASKPANGSTGQLTRNAQQVLQLIEGCPRISAETIGRIIGRSAYSVGGTVGRLNARYGYDIRVNNSHYTLVSRPEATTGSYNRSLWAGIDETTKTYYTRRMRHFGVSV